MVVFEFKTDSQIDDWSVVDDVVMGGRSSGTFMINGEGHGLFKGHVSLENNGGFSSVRYPFSEENVSKFTSIHLRIKGDGRSYQFRLKSNQYDRHSYIYTFDTTGDWQTVEIPLTEMSPSFRGRLLDLPSYPGTRMEEIAFLIGNKKTEDFELEIARITLN